MIQFVAGAAAGYLMGTKAGRRRYEQIRRGYQTAVNSDITKAALRTGRKALANRLDPDPRMHEVRDLSDSSRSALRDGTTIVEADTEHPNDRVDRGGSGRRRFGR
ncbi:hypothetical protein [Corynebacterium heidelbergense]|uniref:YtxH domain-containing protein n=1 Tax=Corynebacterium heidelbergense TaxID=2055947 RepID=A0A364VAJ6_9CORY|nr:hypothetical protein [Corynebacterium heidelbergense]RAV31718.1 hypothetical protein DLJ54_06955 [Corynebacterium heidelbergense]RAV33586.1 hypothetical protein CWC39_07735 [Corynebacterium heidelbergense]WCZ36280.1 hypothetical protein CHEID_03625 [Corynebacterium heidelbergense]